MPCWTVRRWTAAVALGATLLVSGCSEEADPLPPVQVSEPTPTATSGAGNWRVKFSKDELSAYATAVKRWRDYGRRSEKYYRQGKATPASLEMFEDYFYQPDVMQASLRRYEKKKIQFIGQVQLLWTRATKIELARKPPVLVFEECVNVARTSISTNGRVTPSGLRDPVLRTVTMSRIDGGPWLVFGYEGPETGDKSLCEQ
ncbi:hypothetical protein BJ980_003257 [Nocardioides daedukensis]|uniref:Lipoprotein n=1 Tax=Nocardioides daedukensis TaxID=634462 RepID=A0A7Y9S3H7_9ACTN|nr:hypothetical protein [Nocardioides daedukensis]NYG60334.1 hypothetical protein [Nocardioides daedukensis]